jgi:hypothetical protein
LILSNGSFYDGPFQNGIIEDDLRLKHLYPNKDFSFEVYND